MFYTYARLQIQEVEIEMEDVFEEALIDIDNDDAKNPLAGVEYVGDLYAYYRKMEVSLVSLKGSKLYIYSANNVYML